MLKWMTTPKMITKETSLPLAVLMTSYRVQMQLLRKVWVSLVLSLNPRIMSTTQKSRTCNEW